MSDSSKLFLKKTDFTLNEWINKSSGHGFSEEDAISHFRYLDDIDDNFCPQSIPFYTQEEMDLIDSFFNLVNSSEGLKRVNLLDSINVVIRKMTAKKYPLD